MSICEDQNNDDYIRSLEDRNRRLNTQLQSAVDTLQKEKIYKKNQVDGGFYMMSRKAESNLRELQRNNPSAALVFSVLREHMQIGTNAITISNEALCKILTKSRPTISRATKYLSENSYVQIIKTGNINTYVVNERIAFSGKPEQRKAVFSATVIAHECEQLEGWEEVKKLRAVPIICSEEEII
jgi:hypothetical protein